MKIAALVTYIIAVLLLFPTTIIGVKIFKGTGGDHYIIKKFTYFAIVTYIFFLASVILKAQS